jgi:hypothetical protein
MTLSKLTVKSSDGRQKTAHIGGSPPRTMALWMRIELEEERLGNPKFRQPAESSSTTTVARMEQNATEAHNEAGYKPPIAAD